MGHQAEVRVQIIQRRTSIICWGVSVKVMVKFNEAPDTIMDLPCPQDEDGQEYFPEYFRTGRPDKMENVYVVLSKKQPIRNTYTTYEEIDYDPRCLPKISP